MRLFLLQTTSYDLLVIVVNRPATLKKEKRAVQIPYVCDVVYGHTHCKDWAQGALFVSLRVAPHVVPL